MQNKFPFISSISSAMKRCTFVFLSFFALATVYAQQPDSIPLPKDSAVLTPHTDSSRLLKKNRKLGAISAPVSPNDTASIPASKHRQGFLNRFFVKNYPNPRAAALLSFVVPGAGQAYNKRWWKIPIVYGALGGMAWLANDNNQEYQRLKKNYKWVVDGDNATNPTEAPYSLMNSDQLKGYRDQFRKWTELSYLWLGIVHLLGVTDAFVDAHLHSFDVSDDLSFQANPVIESVSNGFGPAFGVGIRLGFGRASKPFQPRQLGLHCP